VRKIWPLIGEENLAPIGIRFPDLQARSETLYLLSYPGPNMTDTVINIMFAEYRGNFDTKCGYLRLSNRSVLQKLSERVGEFISESSSGAVPAATYSPVVSIMSGH
jgi:hypothetical protein